MDRVGVGAGFAAAPAAVEARTREILALDNLAIGSRAAAASGEAAARSRRMPPIVVSSTG